MTRLIWLGAWIVVGIWSLFAFAAYGVLDLVGGVAMRNADAFSSDPETVEWIFHVFGWLRGLSTSLALVVWGTISLAILAVPWLLDRLVGRAGRVPQPSMRRRTDGVIDLDPDQYSVREGRPAGPAAGPAPRIPPRR